MTTIQATDLLKGLEQSLDDYCELNDEGKTAFRMAIAALELFGNAEQLPSAQPVNKDIDVPSTDTISRQDAIRIVDSIDTWQAGWMGNAIESIKALPSEQSEQTDCEYCHEDSDGYVKPIEKNCHAFIRFGMDGWELDLKANGWHGSAKIMYCPMCGRMLKHG